MKKLLYVIIFGCLCLAIDSRFKDVVITPLLGLGWMIWVAGRQHWKDVAVSFIALTVFVAISLFGQERGRIMVRTSSFLLAGGLAVAFSKLRQRSIEALASAHAIIRATPTPMVAADITGSIVAASDETSEILPGDLNPVIGHSFADIFMGHLPPGRAMKMYLDWFQKNGTRTEILYLRGQPDSPLQARILTTGVGGDRLLVAAFEKNRPGDSNAHPPSL